MTVTPVIANWTQTGSAGDAIVLSGQNLGSALQAFVSGTAPNGTSFSLQATVESSNSTGATIVLPKNLPADSAFTLTATNASGTSNNVTVNAPQVWWVGPNEAVQGGVTSIFGENLVLSSTDKPSVTLRMASGQQYALNVTSASAYRVDVQIPTNLPAGSYTLLYNSGAGSGGAIDTSQTQALTLTVSAATAASSIATINVASYGAVANDGKNDAAALNAALTAAQKLVGHNGITQVKVQLGAGEYDIASSLALPDNVDLEGMGAGATTIKAMPGFTVTGSGAGMLWTEQSNYGVGTPSGVTIGNLTVDTNGYSASNVNWTYGAHGNPFNAIWARTIDGVTINSVNLVAKNGQPLDANGAQNLTLKNSKITGEGIPLGTGNHIFIYGNAFYGTNQTEGNILSQGASDVAVYNNTAQDLDPNPTLADVLTNTSQGRFYINQPQSGGAGTAVNQYIAGNTTNGIGPRASLSSSGAMMNVGEQILFEGAGTVAQFSLGGGLFSSSSPTSLKLNTSSANISKAGLVGTLTVLSGTGATETTQITGYNASTGTYTFQTPLAVPLDATSTIQITQGPSQVAIVGNTLQGLTQDVGATNVTAQAGVELYPGGVNVNISGNSFINLPHGVNLWNFNIKNGAGYFVGSSFFQINNNTFSNVNSGVTFVDGYPTNWNMGTLSAADNKQVIGTTIQNNNLSGVNQTAIAFITNGGGAVDVGAYNVASKNTLPAAAKSFQIQGIDGGSVNLLILNNSSSTPLPSAPSLAAAIAYTSGEYPISNNLMPAPEFVGYYLADGSFAESQIASVSGIYNGESALIATAAGSQNWIGVAVTMYPWQGSQVQVLNGGSGSDVLIASSAGKQVLNGGAGNDVLMAAKGTAGANFASAQLTGGAGANEFVFGAGSQYATNTVTDFSAAKGDQVVVAGLVPTAVNPFTAGYLKIQTTAAGSTLLYDAAGGGTSFVTLGTFTGASLTSSNIVVATSAAIPAAASVVATSAAVPAAAPATSSASSSTAAAQGATIPAVVSSTASPASGALNAGKSVSFALKFSEAVTVSGGSPTLVLNDGGVATYSGGSGSNALTFRYTVLAGQNTTSLTATAVKLPSGATIVDSAGNSANLSLTGLAGTGPQIDTAAPAAPVISSDSVSGSSATLIGRAEAAATVTVFDGATRLGSTNSNSTGAWTFTTGQLSSGAHSFTATATDSAGNISAPSAPMDPVIGLAAALNVASHSAEGAATTAVSPAARGLASAPAFPALGQPDAWAAGGVSDRLALSLLTVNGSSRATVESFAALMANGLATHSGAKQSIADPDQHPLRLGALPTNMVSAHTSNIFGFA